ncbi:MAG: nitrophenyl compound nitroreductase subunit ArsF family protein [Candidatus Shapirobacteria bacterium]
MYKLLIIILVVLGLGFVIGGLGNPKAEKAVSDLQIIPTQTSVTSLPKGSEKIEVFVFHTTNRCISCINVGKYSKAVVEEKFPDEFKSGKITFKEINIDLPENYKITQEYKVTGSALFINTIKDGTNIHEEDTTVWRLVTNETQMKNYFETKLKSLL